MDKPPAEFKIYTDKALSIDDLLKVKEESDDWDWKEEARKAINYSESDLKDRTFAGYRSRNPLTAIPRWGCQYLTENVYLKRYLTGLDLDLQVVDTCVNTLTLVNALVLTIPFSVMVDLGGGFWSDLYDVMDHYDCLHWYNYYYTHVRNNLLSTLYFSIAAIMIAVFYYILRPDFPQRDLDSDQKKMLETMQSILDFHVSGRPMNEAGIDTIVDRQFKMRKHVADYKFKAWWVHGRHAILFIFLLTGSAVVSLLALSFQMVGIYMVPNNKLCDFTNTSVISGFLGIASIITIYCIIRLVQTAEISDTDMAKLEKLYEQAHMSKEERAALEKKEADEQEKLQSAGKNCCCFPEPKKASAKVTNDDMSKAKDIIPN